MEVYVLKTYIDLLPDAKGRTQTIELREVYRTNSPGAIDVAYRHYNKNAGNEMDGDTVYAKPLVPYFMIDIL